MAVVWKPVWLLCLLMITLSVNAQQNDTSDQGMALAQGMDEGAAGEDTAGGQQLSENGPGQNATGQNCRQQTMPSTMQVFTALLEPVNTPVGQEAAQDAPRGTLTMYVDSKSGQAWVTGAVHNIHNLTAVTLNAGNSTQVGPVLLPLLPSTARAAQSPQAQDNQEGSQGGQGSINPFNPALPWVTNMEFSNRVALSDLLPLTSNATLNTSGAGAASSAAGADSGNDNADGARPFSYVDVTELDRQLNRAGPVTVVTVFMADGTSSTSFNISNTTGNAGNQGVSSPIRLMQAGLAYVSVHTSQSGQSPEMRGQLVSYGRVMGNSAAIANSFPDALAPEGNYNTTVCSKPEANTTSMASSAANATSNYTAGVAQEAGTRAQNLLANATFTNLAGQTFPAVRTAMNQLTSSGRNLNNSYATFTAVVQAAEDAVKNNGNMNSGRRLLQNGSTSGKAGGSGMGKPAITVFAPSDQAIQTYLQQQGLTQQQLLGNKEQLVELISYHIVPLQALSTRYLASRSRGSVQTLLPNKSLAFTAMNINVAGNPMSVVLLQDAIGSASVRDLDFNDGRVWVHNVDRVLVPVTRANNTQNVGNVANAGNAGDAGNAGEADSAGMNGGNRRLSMMPYRGHLM